MMKFRVPFLQAVGFLSRTFLSFRATLLASALLVIAGCAHTQAVAHRSPQHVTPASLYPPVSTRIEGLWSPGSSQERETARIMAGLAPWPDGKTLSLGYNSFGEALKAERDHAAMLSVNALAWSLCKGHGRPLWDPDRIGPHKWNITCGTETTPPTRSVASHTLSGMNEHPTWRVTIVDNWPLIAAGKWCADTVGSLRPTAGGGATADQLRDDASRFERDRCKKLAALPDAANGAPIKQK